jgi:hypothetical protein
MQFEMSALGHRGHLHCNSHVRFTPESGRHEPNRFTRSDVTKMTTRALNYYPVPTGTVPQKIPKGRVLVHNNIAHDENTPSGERGFRGWFERLPSRSNLVQCECGWSGLLHYRMD